MKRNFKNILSILLRKKQQLSQKQAKAHHLYFERMKL